MGGFNNDLVFAKNADFTTANNLSPAESNGLATNGQLWIGTTAVNAGSTHINVGTLTSPDSSITIGYSSPNITLTSGGAVATLYQEQVGSATPIAGVLNVIGSIVAAGTNPLRTLGGGNTVNVQTQYSQAIAASDATKVGLSVFNSAQFSVDSNGFVSSKGNTVAWQTISASQTLVKNTGYFCISPGGALSLALPTTASSTIGDIIEVTLDGATSWTITQAASQQIRFSSSQTTAGVGGSLASTAAGDTIKMVYQATGKWNVISAIGNLTVT